MKLLCNFQRNGTVVEGFNGCLLMVLIFIFLLIFKVHAWCISRCVNAFFYFWSQHFINMTLFSVCCLRISICAQNKSRTKISRLECPLVRIERFMCLNLVLSVVMASVKKSMQKSVDEVTFCNWCPFWSMHQWKFWI